VQQGDAAPAWCPVRLSILKVHVAHRQRHHGKAGARHLVDDAGFGLRHLECERAAMSAQNFAFEAHGQGSVGNDLQRESRRVVGLIDVEIEIVAMVDGGTKQDFEARLQVRAHVGHGAENPRAMLPDSRQHGAHVVGVDGMVDAEQGRGLKGDAAGPFGAQLGKDRPRDADLRADRIEMGADRTGAVGKGGFQRKAHPGAHVGGMPVGLPVGSHGGQRAHEGAVGIGSARPDVTLVEVGVALGETREDDAALHVEAGQAVFSRYGAGRQDGDNPALRDGQVDAREALTVGCQRRCIDETARHAGIEQAEGGRGGQSGETGVHGMDNL
jgi:hypothetical protein